jgi:hypothetical protein
MDASHMTPCQHLGEAYNLLEHLGAPARMRSAQATIALLAIQLQEAPNQEQRQVGGPAVGTYQFESGGGIEGVLQHKASSQLATAVCKALGVAPTRDGVYAALQTSNDVLDACFARLLLWTDPHALPAIGDVEGAFQLYLRTWRPGAYTRGNTETRRKLRQKWSVNYAKALEQVTS